MRDVDLARRAQQRGFVTAEQLREAQQFAAGGRSLLSVLLDLGYLKPDDLLRLGETPAAPRSRKLPWILIGAAPIAALFVAVLWPSTSRPMELQGGPPSDEPAPRFSEQAVDRARQILARAERSLDGRGRPPASADRDLRRAAALLEEATAEAPRPEDQLSLARIYELLDEWEGSRALYQRVLADWPDLLPALLGAARTSLLLRDPAEARLLAERACARPQPPAEAYFLRGAAAHAQGDAAGASLFLGKASQLDGAFRPRIEALVSGQAR